MSSPSPLTGIAGEDDVVLSSRTKLGASMQATPAMEIDETRMMGKRRRDTTRGPATYVPTPRGPRVLAQLMLRSAACIAADRLLRPFSSR